MRRWLVFVSVVALAVGVAAGASAGWGSAKQRWLIRDLGTLDRGKRTSEAAAINERGEVVGRSDTAKWNVYHAFLWRDGRLVDLGTLWQPPFPGNDQNLGYSYAEGINGRGQVIGTSYVGQGRAHAFLWQNGKMTDLGIAPGFVASSPTDLNERGQIVGSLTGTPVGHDHAFLWQDGKMLDLGTLPGRDASFAIAINGRGQIVGGSKTVDDSFGEHLVLWQNREMSDLGMLGAKSIDPEAINDHGQVVGEREIEKPAPVFLGWRAFLWQKGTVTDISRPGRDTWALAINNGGQVAGWLTKGADDVYGHAFLWQSGKLTDLGTLGGRGSTAVGINARGQIVGYSNTKPADDEYTHHAFVWQDGKMLDLGTLGGKASQATAINDRGQIVGWATTKTGAKHAVLWTLKPAS